MEEKNEILKDLKNLALDRTAVTLMREDIARIREDEKQKELPALQREALEKERKKLESCLTATLSHISRLERLLSQLTEEECEVLDRTLIHPYPDAVFDLATEYHCESTRIYRVRARALSRLTRLRYGAGA